MSISISCETNLLQTHVQKQLKTIAAITFKYYILHFGIEKCKPSGTMHTATANNKNKIERNRLNTEMDEEKS